MKIPIQGQAVKRNVSTAIIIGAKGIVQNGNPIWPLETNCFKCLQEYKSLG